jgi:hypothetical protein
MVLVQLAVSTSAGLLRRLAGSKDESGDKGGGREAHWRRTQTFNGPT